MKPIYNYIFLSLLGILLTVTSCSDGGTTPDDPIVEDPQDTTTVNEDITTLTDGPVDFSFFKDTYAELADPSMASSWGHYNVHDPSYIVDDKFTYCYNTDVAFGHEVRPGIQIRRSINLVEWEFVGWAFVEGIPTKGSNYIIQNGGVPNAGLWAPYIMKVDDEYRLYYSLSSNVGRLSAIGLATSKSPKGPFREQGLVVTSKDDASIQTNAIDPSVIISQDGSHWMYYGSSWDAIYKLELNPETGLAMRNEDKGVRVAHRGFTGSTINGNIEGPEIIYNPDFGKYYLFISYDWLQTKYNVRVGRSDSPTGPFYDITGKDMNDEADDLPMILAPYRFTNHSGWQGVSHMGVFEKDGSYYMGHQGRPGVNSFYMIMHTRQIFWTEDGWPLVSGQRYATEDETPVDEAELIGEWEHLDFQYTIVPGFAEEQTSAGFSVSQDITLRDDGTVDGNVTGTWSYSSPWLTITPDGGEPLKLHVERGRDWENEIESTILYTGLNKEYLAVWGKKKI